MAKSAPPNVKTSMQSMKSAQKSVNSAVVRAGRLKKSVKTAVDRAGKAKKAMKSMKSASTPCQQKKFVKTGKKMPNRRGAGKGKVANKPRASEARRRAVLDSGVSLANLRAEWQDVKQLNDLLGKPTVNFNIFLRQGDIGSAARMYPEIAREL